LTRSFSLCYCFWLSNSSPVPLKSLKCVPKWEKEKKVCKSMIFFRVDTKWDPIYERDQKSTTTKIKRQQQQKYLPHELIACFRVNSKNLSSRTNPFLNVMLKIFVLMLIKISYFYCWTIIKKYFLRNAQNRDALKCFKRKPLLIVIYFAVNSSGMIIDEKINR
jgi:hypothetical protein